MACHNLGVSQTAPSQSAVGRDPTQCVIRRIVAACIDSIIVLAPLVAIGFGTGAIKITHRVNFGPGWWGILGVWLIAMAYWTLSEQLWNGQTVGKRFLGIRVIARDGSAQVDWGRSILRNVARVFDQFVCFIVGPVLMLTTTGHRRIGDFWGRTLVVKTKAEGHIEATPWSS